jgi:hypothetical protein
MPDGEVPLDEETLLDFDRDIFDWSEEHAVRMLAEHHDLYLNHLLVAKHLEFWASSLDERKEAGDPNHPDLDKGFILALEELAASLRLGRYLPGGDFYAIHEPQPWRRWTKELWGIDPPKLDEERRRDRW